MENNQDNKSTPESQVAETPSPAVNPLAEKILALHGEIQTREKTDRLAFSVPLAAWPHVAPQLAALPGLEFDMLVAHTAVDWLKRDAFELIYELYSTSQKQWVVIGVNLPRANPVSFSVASIWPIAEWQEREIFDLFGIKFAQHPDLRRLFLEDDWVGFPLRKDYQDEFMLERPW